VISESSGIYNVGNLFPKGQLSTNQLHSTLQEHRETKSSARAHNALERNQRIFFTFVMQILPQSLTFLQTFQDRIGLDFLPRIDHNRPYAYISFLKLILLRFQFMLRSDAQSQKKQCSLLVLLIRWGTRPEKVFSI
jgi:hypothetical protein